MTLPSIQPFVRSRLTWLAYAMLAYIGFTQSMLGPLMPFLRSELQLNYTLGGFLPAAIAVGLILSGLSGASLARHWGRGVVFWGGAFGLAIMLIGFPIFWLARLATLNIIGLFITGFGIANMFPLTLSIAVGLAGGQSNLASARVSLGVGTALLTAPLFLGWLADRIGLQSTYSMVIVLMVAACDIVMNNRWLSARRVVSRL